MSETDILIVDIDNYDDSINIHGSFPYLKKEIQEIIIKQLEDLMSVGDNIEETDD